MKTNTLSAFTLTLMVCTQAYAQDWSVDPEASSIEVRYTQGSNESRAVFERFTAQISFDPTDLDAASIRAEIDMGSFASGNSQIDGAVASAQWFATPDFPLAVFESTAVNDAGEGIYAIDGDLTIRDVTLPVTLTGPITIDGSSASAAVEAILDRSQFGVGQGDFESESQVKHAVAVAITIAASSS